MEETRRVAADPAVADAAWRVFSDALLAKWDELVEAVVVRLRAAPGFKSLPISALRPPVERNMQLLIPNALRASAPPPGEHLDPVIEAGHLRARQGLPIDDMLLGYRYAVDEVREHARLVVEEQELPVSVLLEFTSRVLAWTDAAMIAAAAAHRETELELKRHEQDHRANLVRGILFGSVPGGELTVQATAYGLDTKRRYHAFRARPQAEGSNLELERRLGVVHSAERRHGLAALVDGDLAGFVEKAPAAGLELGTSVGVGPAVPLADLATSFQLATRALETATAAGHTCACAFDDLGLRPAVLADSDVGERLLERYVAPLVKRVATAVLLDTVECYLENGQRLEQTAAELHLHPNSVRYRLRRFSEVTGADLTRVEDIVEVWWALERARLTGRRRARRHL